MLLTPTRLSIIVCTALVPKFYKGERSSVPELVAKHRINPRTLNPALTRLVKAGVLNSRIGGTDRGYILAKDPKQISIYDIVSELEGGELMPCCGEVIQGVDCLVNCAGDCLALSKLNAALLTIKQELESISLYDQYVDGLKSKLGEDFVAENL